MSAPKVVGLDLSMSATGVALADGTTQTVKTNSKHGDRRMEVIVTSIHLAIRGDAGEIGRDICDLVVMEEAPPGLKGAAIKAIHMVHGAVRLWLIDFGIPYAVINPTTLKGYATGNTKADKTAMAMAAFKRTGREFGDDNQADAAWLRWAGLDRLGAPEFALPKAQRIRLDAADWPLISRKDSAS